MSAHPCAQVRSLVIRLTTLSYKKNMPWHILAPRAVACDNLHLRASAHHWHMSAFCVIENSSEFPITQKAAANSAICLQISAAVYLLFDLFLLYIWPPTTGSYGRSQVRRLQLPQTSREDPELSGVSSPLRPHHRSRGLRSS